MPYSVGEKGSYGCSGYPVIKDEDKSVMGCHDTAQEAGAQIAAIEANENKTYEEKDTVVSDGGVGTKNPQGWPGTAIEHRKPKLQVSKMNLADELTPEERAYHDALVRIAAEYGPFDKGTSSIWVGYVTPQENEDASIGVKCGNCSMHYDNQDGTMGCKIVSYLVQENAKCRLAAIPDGYVNVQESKMEKSFWSGSFDPRKAL